ncbi:hypothetical protein BU17DRAFT_30149, partial [Hysterangium stoloniferum]
LLQLPQEIVEFIVLNIINASDLLSLGLTCQIFSHFIFPRHLKYHTVSAPINHSSIWQHLIRSPACCLYIRKIEVLDDNNKSYTNRF